MHCNYYIERGLLVLPTLGKSTRPMLLTRSIQLPIARMIIDRIAHCGQTMELLGREEESCFTSRCVVLFEPFTNAVVGHLHHVLDCFQLAIRWRNFCCCCIFLLYLADRKQVDTVALSLTVSLNLTAQGKVPRKKNVPKRNGKCGEGRYNHRCVLLSRSTLSLSLFFRALFSFLFP